MNRKKALELRRAIEQASSLLDDKDASKAPELARKYPNDGSLIEAHTRINWNGQLYVAAVALWATEQNNPDNAPTLWERIMYRDGIRVIPETITVTKMFSKGERGWWGDDLYESLVDNNAYTPVQHAPNWRLV